MFLAMNTFSDKQTLIFFVKNKHPADRFDKKNSLLETSIRQTDSIWNILFACVPVSHMYARISTLHGIGA